MNYYQPISKRGGQLFAKTTFPLTLMLGGGWYGGIVPALLLGKKDKEDWERSKIWGNQAGLSVDLVAIYQFKPWMLLLYLTPEVADLALFGRSFYVEMGLGMALDII